MGISSLRNDWNILLPPVPDPWNESTATDWSGISPSLHCIKAVTDSEHPNSHANLIGVIPIPISFQEFQKDGIFLCRGVGIGLYDLYPGVPIPPLVPVWHGSNLEPHRARA